MRIRRSHSLLLVLALLLGQALALAHTSQHSIIDDSTHNCPLCLVQHNLDHAPLTTAPLAFSFHLGTEAPQLAALSGVARSTDTHYPIRAPPVRI